VKERLVANPAVNYARDENGRLRNADMKFDPNSPAKLALKALLETGQTSEEISFTISPLFFQSTAGTIYVPIDLLVSAGLVSENAIVFGAALSADGIASNHFEEKATFVKTAEGPLRWEFPLVLQPGSYKLHVGVMNEGGPTMGTRIIDLEVPDYSLDLMLSSVLLFSDAAQTGEPNGSFGRAFMLGGYHFTPKLQPRYTQADEIEGVFYAYNYGLDGDKPNLTLEVSFSKDAQPCGRVPEDKLLMQAADMSLHIFGFGLNINNFKEPGEYKLTLKVNDKVRGQSVTKEIPFTMVAQ